MEKYLEFAFEYNDSFYTKEAINRLVAIWCENTNSIINGKQKNVVV